MTTLRFPTRIIAHCILLCACIEWSQSQAAPQSRAPQIGPSFQELALKAASAREAGDLGKAAGLYRKALSLKPNWQEGLWYVGSLSYDRNQYPQAVADLRRLTTLNSSLGEAWALLGLSEFETHDFSGALRHLERARRLGLSDHQELANVSDYHLAILLNARGRCDEGRALLSNLFLSGVKSEDVQVALGLTLLRVPLLPQQLDPSEDALIHSAGELAALITEKKYGDADHAFQDLLKQYPSTPFAHYAYGAMLASQGMEDASEEQFRQETLLTPDSALAYTEWAFIELQAERYDSALSLARTAGRLAPHFFMPHYLLGTVFLVRGEIAASVAQLETARRLAPESVEVLYSLARAYAKAGKPELARREHAEFARLKSLEAAAAGDNPPVREMPIAGPTLAQPAPSPQ